MNSTVLVLAVLCSLVVSTTSSGVFEVIFTYFSNPKSEDYNGDYCDETVWGSKTSCDTFLRICLASPRPSPPNDKCPIKISEKGNTDSFSMNLRMAATFSVLKKPYGAFVAAWDYDSTSDDDLIDTFSFDFTNKPTVNGTIPSWTSASTKGRRSSDKSTLSYKYRIYCNTHYYGTGCDKYCKYTDLDNTGHYRCANNGNKICLKNWFMPQTNCLKYCRPRNDTGGHYKCDSNGDKICHPNWHGQNCTVNCVPRNGTEGHYKCDSNGDKICHPNWSGQNCTVNCVPRNGTEGHYKCDSNGYKICHPNWYGQNCTVNCVPRNGTEGHYNCDSNGDKSCHLNCTVKCVPRNGTEGH